MTWNSAKNASIFSKCFQDGFPPPLEVRRGIESRIRREVVVHPFPIGIGGSVHHDSVGGKPRPYVLFLSITAGGPVPPILPAQCSGWLGLEQFLLLYISYEAKAHDLTNIAASSPWRVLSPPRRPSPLPGQPGEPTPATQGFSPFDRRINSWNDHLAGIRLRPTRSAEQTSDV